MQKQLYIDLFSGCGGLALGLHNAGWEGLFAIEKNKDAFETLKYNQINNFKWPSWLEIKNHDINNILHNYFKELKLLKNSIDLIAGGPPCQGFSMAGRRKENDQRNKLIDSYIEFVKIIQPKLLFFENVKGFTIGFKKNDKRGKPFSTYVVEELQKLGYDVCGEIVNFSEFGIPQKRERFILVGRKKGSAKEFFEKIKLYKQDFLKDKNLTQKVTISEAISDLLQSNGTMPSLDSPNFQAGIYAKAKSNYQKYMRKNLKLTNKIANSHRFAKHKKETINRFEYILKNSQANKNISNELKEKYNLKKHTIVPLCANSPSPTLTTLPDDYIHYCEPRILTVREYARLQSFSDDYEFKGPYTTGGKRRKFDVPRYTQIGNAIPPLFAELAGIVLKDML